MTGRKIRRACSAVALVAGALAAVGVLAPRAQGATFTVTNTNDAGAGSLREAVIDANLNPGPDTIEVPAGTYTLTSGDLAVSEDLTLVGLGGAGTTIIDGNGTSRIIDVTGAVPLTITGLTLRNGNAGSAGGGAIRSMSGGSLTITASYVSGNQARFGGAVAKTGASVTVVDSTFTQNRSQDVQSGADAGTFYLHNLTLTITGSTFAANQAILGNGGVISSTAVTGTITNSTITGNSASYNGGALRFDASSSVTLRYVTLAGNTAGTNLGAGILSIGQASVTLQNSLLLDNLGDGAPSNCETNAGGTFTSAGGNLSDDTTCTSLTQPTDLNDNNGTTLGPLADNGGPTLTMALDAGDTALNAAPCLDTVTVDQRAVVRPQGTGCDIGAYELVVQQPTTTTTTTTTSTTTTTTTTTTAPTSTSSTLASSSTTSGDGAGAANAGASGASGASGAASGSLPITGEDPAALGVFGALLVTAGAASLLAARRRSRRSTA